MKIEEKIEEIRKLVKEINSYDDLLFMYEGDRIDLECTKYELWELCKTYKHKQEFGGIKLYGKAVITFKNGMIRGFAANNEADIADYLYSIVGDEVEESNGVPTYIEASSWCPTASSGDVFESARFTIAIVD